MTSIPQDLIASALAEHKAGRLQSALSLYGKVLSAQPDHLDALHLAGVVAHQLGDHKQAEGLMARALRRQPRSAGILFNYGHVLRALGRHDDAALAWHQAAAIDPRQAGALVNLAQMRMEQGRLSEAFAQVQSALAIAPNLHEAHYNLAIILRKMFDAGDVEAARTQAGAWLARFPGNTLAQHTAAAFGVGAPPDRASDGYVQAVFDGFSARFDKTLQKLGYRAPQALAEALELLLPDLSGLDILDAGCGTGLCAPLLKARAKTLVGVDLSPGMLDKAHARGLYDRLAAAELTGFLEGAPAAFDLIVAADVLCYFGDLDAVLRAAHGALRPGGHIAFTVERELDAEGFVLRTSGRYAHAERHVRSLLTQAGFTILGCDPQVLRHEAGMPVEGLVVLAAR
jgi:predicted TPR repeat methyltransferase